MAGEPSGREPWSKFYWSDWRGDPRLRSCGLAARGLWMEMLSIMHEAQPYGHLLVNGHAVTEHQLAIMVGASVSDVRRYRRELCASGVPSITEAGIWFSRRMVRDQAKRETAQKTGALGGNPKLTQGYNRPGYVYLVRRDSDGAVKIGISTDPAKRLYKIRQQHQSDFLTLLDSAFVADMGRAEAELHARLSHCGNGEWFALAEDDRETLFRLVLRLKANGKGETEVRLKSRATRDPEARSQTPEGEGKNPIPAQQAYPGNGAREPGNGAAAPDFLELGERCCVLAGIDTAKTAIDFSHVIGWMKAGFDQEADVVSAIERAAARPGYKPPGSLNYFTKMIREAHEMRVAAEAAGSQIRNGKADDGWL